jgi:hypothetical protein
MEHSLFQCSIWQGTRIPTFDLFLLANKFSIKALFCNIRLFRHLKVSSSSRNNTACIVVLPLQQWLRKLTRILRCTYITYVVNLYRTVWKWLTVSRDRICTDPLQATALTQITRLQVSNSLQYPAFCSWNWHLICVLRFSQLIFRTVHFESTFRHI